MYLFKNRLTDSLQKKFRKQRFEVFLSLISTLEKPISILDVGGTVTYWENLGGLGKEDLSVTLLNLDPFETSYPNLKSIVGDARDLSMFRNDEFDIVYSNSVIEHVGDFRDQKAMADEICRVGKRYFVQTPNFWFPIEPHYRAVFFQLYPVWLKTWRLRVCGVGRKKRSRDKIGAMQEAQRIRLLCLNELERLFPGANFKKERFAGLVKSICAYKGFENK